MSDWLQRTRTTIATLASSIAGMAILCGFMVSTPPGTGPLQTVPLPPGPLLSEEDLFAAQGTSAFFFFDPKRSRRLWHLRVSHPMGSRHFLNETWNRIPLPDLGSLKKIRDMSYAEGTLFLSGRDENGTPIVRAYPIQQSRSSGVLEETISSHTDFYPPSGGAPIRKLLYDPLTHVLWIGYDNGEVEVGPHILVTPGNLILDSPAGYLELPGTRNEGPPELPLIRTPRLPKDRCITCTLTLVPRKSPVQNDRNQEEIPNLPIRSTHRMGSRLGILAFGNRTILLRDVHSHACRIRIRRNGPTFHPCRTIDTEDIPLAAEVSGSRLVFLTVPDARGKSHFATLNPVYLDNLIRRGIPLKKGFLERLLRKKGQEFPLPSDARPFPSFIATSPTRTVIFGRHHLYRLSLFRASSPSRATRPASTFEP